jgi:NAD(P)-dependent dehydrogenase (short-subunit alcohol dehydrogenase family)
MSQQTSKRVAVVTGANRGLGFEAAKQLAEKGYEVILTARSAGDGEKKVAELAKLSLSVRFFALDVTSSQSIDSLKTFLEKTYGRLDVLVNNAGVFPDDRATGSAFNTSLETVRTALETNTFGIFLLCQKLIPLMQKNDYGRVVNVSSGMGQLSEMQGNYPAYRISKTALNAVTKIFSEETKGKNILVNSVCPGWVRTDMGGADAHRDIPQGASSIVWAAVLPDKGPTGGFFRDGQPLPW